MQSMANLLPQAMFNKPGQIMGNPPSKALPEESVKLILQKLDQIYPGRFMVYLPDGEAMADLIDTWGIGLSGITNEEIERGLKACLVSDRAPTLPEFRHLCRPPRDAGQAYREAANLLSRNPVDWKGDALLYWAVQGIGAYEVRTLPYAGEIKARWEKMIREYEAKTLPPPPETPIAAIPDNRHKNRAVGEAHLSQIKNILGMQR